MKNKETVNGQRHDRPCFFALADRIFPDLFWLIPISSKLEKYHGIYNDKVEKLGKCNTICFAEVLGHERAFLIQNMFPITKQYITDIYVDRNTSSAVTIQTEAAKNIVKNAREVLKLHNRGFHILFPDVGAIYEKLTEDMKPLEHKESEAMPEHTPWNDILVASAQKSKAKKVDRGQEHDR